MQTLAFPQKRRRAAVTPAPAARPISVAPRRALAMVGSALVLTGLCTRAIFKAGYVVQVDAAWGPKALPVQSGFYYPIALLQHATITLFGGELTGKMYVAGVVFLCAMAPMILMRARPCWAMILAGALGVLNPWVYDRIVEGQWTVAAAAACLFVWLAAFDHLQVRSGWRPVVATAAAGAAATAFSPGFLAMVLLLTVAGLVAARVWEDRTRLRCNLFAIGLLPIVLGYGLFAFVFSHGDQSSSRVAAFSQADFRYFRADGSRFGLGVKLLGLEGYWGERTGRFPVADGGAHWWPLVVAILVLLAFFGAWQSRGHAWLLPVGVVGLFVSASTAMPHGAGVLSRLVTWIPPLGGFREPGKWGALWLLALVAITADLIGDLDARRAKAHRAVGAAHLLAITLLCCAVALGGLREISALPRTLTPVRFPSDWYAAEAYLRRLPEDHSNVAVLPWHQYLVLPFAGDRLVLNPAPVFFTGHILSSTDPELGATASAADQDPLGALAASPGPTGCGLADALRARRVGTVVIEPVLEGASDMAALRRCHFTVMRGGPGQLAVLGG